MAKFMSTHTVPPGKFSPDQLRQFAQAAQQDPTVKGYRSFANLGEGKVICVMEVSSSAEVEAWFKKMECLLIASRKLSLKVTEETFNRPELLLLCAQPSEAKRIRLSPHRAITSRSRT